MASIANAKEVIQQELNKPEFTADSVARIEAKIQELETARIEWESDPELAGLHARYLAKFEALDEEVKRNLSREIERARARQDNLRAELNGIELPASVLGSAEIMEELQRLGIVRGDRAVFENSDTEEKITKYLDYLNFISDVERDGRGAVSDPEGLVRRYRELLNEGTDWILDKRFLQYKYIEALYDDIIRRGYVLQKNATGEYTIVCPEIDAAGNLIHKNLEDSHPNHPYLDIVNARNTRNMIDVAAVTSIMRKNFSLDRQGIVGQQTLVVSILQQHDIRSLSGVTIQKADLLLLDWDHVKTQIDEKLKSVVNPDDGESMQAYNELMYIRNFIEHREYDKPDYSAAIFAEANAYRQGFLNEKALIDAFGGNLENVTPDSFGDIIKNMGGDLQGGLLIFALIAFIAGKKSLAVGAAGLGLLGPSIGGIIETGINGVTDRSEILDQLEIIRPHAVIPILDNDSHQAQFEKLAGINKTNLENRVDDAGRALPAVGNNFIIAKILNEIHKSGTDIDLSSSTVVNDILTAMGSKDVTNTEFPNYRGATHTIASTDIEAFLKLIESDGFKESDDKTLSDVFTSGLDIRNTPYSSFDFTVDENFDRALNNHLRARWNLNTTTDGREKVQNLQQTIEAKLSAGITDNFFDSVTGRNTADVIRGLPERLSNIDDLIAEINSMGLASASIDPLVNTTNGILPRYKTFMEADAAMSEYDGVLASGKTFISDKWGDLSTFVGGLAGRTGISDLETEKNEIDAIITKITPTTFEINGTPVDISTDSLLQSVVDRANTIKAQLEQRSQALQAEIDDRNEALRRQAFNIPNIAAVNNLSLDEGDTAYREAVVEIKQAIDNFGSMVTAFERSGDEVGALSNANIAQYTLLKAAEAELRSMTLTGSTAFPSKLWLRIQLQQLFNSTGVVSGGAAEKYQTKAKTEFTSYFAVLNTHTTTVSGVTTSFSDINTLLNSKDTLDDLERDLGNTISGFQNVYSFMARSEKRSESEIAYASAQELFGNTFTVTHDTLTTESIIQDIIEKREELAEGIQTYINGLAPTGTPPTYAFSVLEDLQDMESRGVIGFARQSELGIRNNVPGLKSQVEIDYANKVEEVTLEIIESVPSNASGVALLRQIDTKLGFNANNGLWNWVKTMIGGRDQVEVSFDNQVQIVGADILSNFNDDLNGLNDILAFKASGRDYQFIVGHVSDFATRYDARLQEIRENIILNTLSKDIPQIVTSIRGITNAITDPARSGEKRKLLSFTSSSTNTIKLLMDEMGITSSLPSGNHTTRPAAGTGLTYLENERQIIYNTLSSLKLI